MSKLKDMLGAQAAAEQESRTAVSSFKSSHDKKMISAYVDTEKYNNFKAINERRGISSNKVLNLLIADYVLEYEKLLDK